MVYGVTAGILLAYLVLVWFIGTWLHPPGSGIWVLRGALAVIGIIAAGSFLWFYRKSKASETAADAAGSQAAPIQDIELLVNEAMRRLKSSPVARGASLGNLPLVFLVGDVGSTKTSTIIQSSLDPELLAGHVYQDNNILPTRVANIWYTRQAVFVDPAGSMLSQPPRWKRLVKLMQPGRVSSAFGKGQQAPRAAIVCYDCENFLKPGASETIPSAARKLASRLQEISQLLGISFPIYVLFTKADRLGARGDGGSFFLDYVAGLSKNETSQVLGATLPVRSLQSAGVYAEEETRRLTKAFDELFYSLAERRLDLLARENEAAKLPGIYEFPRELRKFRNLLVQFLVDMARPSQLAVNPFLRGFYFTGVRPVVVEDVVAAAPDVGQVAESSAGGFDAGATRIFGGGGGGGGYRSSQAPVAARVAGSRKVPQWVFLTQFFNEIILKDKVALSASGFSSRVSLLRRVLLGAVAALGLVCAIGFLISFLGNRALEDGVQRAAEDLRTVRVAPNQVPSRADLQKLDNLRQELQTLTSYERDGVPLHLRWGLYVGDGIYPDARQIYFDRFRSLLFGETQGKLLTALRTLKDKPDANAVYEIPYNELKAYLMTTSNPEKSTKEFLAPVLQSHWQAGKNVDEQSAALARSQFDFYSTELIADNPYPDENARRDKQAIEHARVYLGQFGGIDRYYYPLLAEASRKNAELSFNEQFRDSVGTILSSYRVKGAFTRGGFAFMQEAIRKPSNYMRGEEWVLGKNTATQLDPATLQQKLTERYYQDFINEWRNVLERSHVVNFKLDEASDRLEKLTSATSPLLELLWFVAHNTDVGVPDVSDVFAPVHAVEPPGPAQGLPTAYVIPANKDYVAALAKLQTDILTIVRSPSPNDPNLNTQALNSAEAAKLQANAATSARVDQRFHTESSLRSLLQEPIIIAEKDIIGSPVEALNNAGRAFCSQFDPIVHRYYPFNPTSERDLPIDQLNTIFAPGAGALWTAFKDAKLSSYTTKEGSRYVANPSGTVRISPAFLIFYNRAVAVSDALYQPGSQTQPGAAAVPPTPHFTYSLKQLPSNVEGVMLNVGSETLATTGQQKTFNWAGAGETVQATAKGNLLGSPYSGPWAIFHYVSDAHWRPSGPGSNDLEWVMQSNGRDIILPSGKKMSYSYQLTVNGFNPLHSSELSGLRCVSTVAQQ